MSATLQGEVLSMAGTGEESAAGPVPPTALRSTHRADASQQALSRAW